MRTVDYSHNDPRAPFSLWGAVQTEILIAEGVRFVETAGHGGYMIAKEVAEEKLTSAALALAERFCGFYCFEEDCLTSIVLLEHPEWGELFSGISAQELRKSIQRYHPQYFDLLETQKA